MNALISSAAVSCFGWPAASAWRPRLAPAQASREWTLSRRPRLARGHRLQIVLPRAQRVPAHYLDRQPRPQRPRASLRLSCSAEMLGAPDPPAPEESPTPSPV